MKWIKQSFIFTIQHPRESLLLAIIGLATLSLSVLLHLLGTVVASIILILLQASVFNYFAKKPALQIKNKSSILLAAAISIPTNIMMGSVIGLLQGADNFVVTLGMVVVFSIFCALSYIVIGHLVGFIIQQEMLFEPALNAALKGFREHRWPLLLLSCLSAVILLLSALPFGLGLIISLPLHFYLYYFSYTDLYVPKKEKADAVGIDLL